MEVTRCCPMHAMCAHPIICMWRLTVSICEWQWVSDLMEMWLGFRPRLSTANMCADWMVHCDCRQRRWADWLTSCVNVWYEMLWKSVTWEWTHHQLSLYVFSVDSVSRGVMWLGVTVAHYLSDEDWSDQFTIDTSSTQPLQNRNHDNTNIMHRSHTVTI